MEAPPSEIYSLPSVGQENIYQARRRKNSLSTPIAQLVKSVWLSYYSSLCESMKYILNLPRQIVQEMCYFGRNPRVLLQEVLCGVAMAVVVIPESISFAYLTNMSPIQGLYSTFFIGFLAAALNGYPTIISGCSGAICAVTKMITSSTGPLQNYPVEIRENALLLCIVLSGVIQILFGVFKIGQLIKILPQSVMAGFVNGLAIIIFLSQLPSFQVCDATDGKTYLFRECPEEFIHYISLHDVESWMTLVCLLLCVVAIFFFPKVPVLGRYVPASLVAMLLGSAFEHGFVRAVLGYQTRILETTAPIQGGWPSFHFPSIPNDGVLWQTVILYAFYVAIIADIESVLTVLALCEQTDTPVKDSMLNQECVAQGLGNFFAGLFGGVGGNAMIGESNLNYISGSRHRLSGMLMGWVVIFIVVWLSPVVNLVPLASLTAVIFSITFHTFYWPCLWTMHKMRKSDVIIIVATTTLAVVTNLGIAVGVGFIIAAINNTWDSSNLLHVHSKLMQLNISQIDPNIVNFLQSEKSSSSFFPGQLQDLERKSVIQSDFPQTSSPSDIELVVNSSASSICEEKLVNNEILTPVKVYEVDGPVFFGSSRIFSSIFTTFVDPTCVVIDFDEGSLNDFSALSSLVGILSRYQNLGKMVWLINLSVKSRKQCLRSREFIRMTRRVGMNSFRLLTTIEFQEEKGRRSYLDHMFGNELTPFEPLSLPLPCDHILSTTTEDLSLDVTSEGQEDIPNIPHEPSIRQRIPSKESSNRRLNDLTMLSPDLVPDAPDADG